MNNSAHAQAPTPTVTIVGQGYVGMPLAEAAVHAGWRVHGLDVTQSLVDALNSGVSHIDDLDQAALRRMLDAGYAATTDAAVIAESDVVVMCVPTPLNEAGGPDLAAVRGASTAIGRHVTKGTTVVLESTTYPGTTEEVVLPILEAESGLSVGDELLLAFSPERVDPGNKKFGIKNTPKLVGGFDEASLKSALQFYGSFVDTVVPMRGLKEAETAKLLENTFRHINIAMVNEMAKFCHKLDIDIWDVIEGASTKPFGFMKFTPGPGVGGHCIPIDPNYLSYKVRQELGHPFRFVELAQEINASMPEYVVDRATELLNDESKALRGSTVLILGVTYKPDIADQRESPAQPVAEKLLSKGAKVRFHDPMVETWDLGRERLQRVASLDAEVADADLVILLQGHASYDVESIARAAKSMLDTRGAAPEPAQRL